MTAQAFEPLFLAKFWFCPFASLTQRLAMNRFVALAVVSLGSFASLLQAGELMPLQIATRLGLEQAWRRQLQVPAGAQSVVDQQFYVHAEDPREYVEIVVAPKASDPKAQTDPKAAADKTQAAAGQVMFRLPVDQVGANGLEIGKQEAERLARNENRRLKRRGYTGTITSRLVPKIRLYTLGNDGTCECRDAESGESVWLARVGDRRLGYNKMGIGEKFVTVINGANLIKLDVKTGEEIAAMPTTGTPLFGAVHAGGFSLVPTIRSGVEGYPLDDIERYPFMEMVEGIALAPPTKAPDSNKVAWATDRGFVYLMELQGSPSVQFRLNTDGNVGGRIVSATGNRFFFASEAGQVYGVRGTRVGEVLWSRPYAEPFYNDPMIVGDQLLLRSAYGNLFSLGLDDGISKWVGPIPNVDALLAAFDGRVYVRLLSGGFGVIDLEAGKLTDIIYEMLPQQLLVNAQTNRLYLVSNSGAVQCLRPAGKEMPTVNVVLPEAKKPTDADDPAAAKPAGPQPVINNAVDPFAPAAGGDPFGAAAGADPFAPPAGGGGGAGAMADPFGADPFGN
jgi:outer membrane protein assembly factor BamB